MCACKIETHLHTVHVSACARLDADALAEGCAKAGYAAVAVTDHYNRDTFAYLHIDTKAPGDFVTPFLEGFRRMEAACGRRGVKVYRGAELRFDECANDYLLYNCPDGLLAEPEKVFRMGIAAFAPWPVMPGPCWSRPTPTGKNAPPPSPAILTAWRS